MMMKRLWQEFKTFIQRGNVMDLAVGVIIGGAFGKIITSLVGDVLMPLLGVIMGGVDLTSLKWVLTPAVMQGDVVVSVENALYYGRFLQNVLDFFLIALSVFALVRVINRLRAIGQKPPEQPKEEKPPAPTSEQLLTEIRDLLKEDHEQRH